jgi:mannose-6-phosphate isomerase-like protein (cupin superfamily)
MADTDTGVNEAAPAAATPPVTARTYKYVKPDFGPGRGSAKCRLAETDLATIGIKRIKEGGENELHMHPNADGFWTVLAGRVRFYTTDDELIADLGPMEGVVIPRTFPYWFESADPAQDLEILQVLVCSTPVEGTARPAIRRIGLAERKGRQAVRVD